ncbi:MAG: hypothetical protein K0S34_468 [Bacillales bacterium]|jgi:hypothetical protein|nr:hypothetical protein [Bacillales bacterium]
MSDKLFHLKQIRNEIGEEQFKFAAASIVADYYYRLMKKQGLLIDRMTMSFRVNLHLRDLGCDEVCYGFFRKYN